MAMFEEEAWDISPDVQQLDDGLFGGETERKNKKSKKKNTDASTSKSDQSDVKLDGKKAKRGKRGKKKSKKEKAAQSDATTEPDAITPCEAVSISPKKKLKLKRKVQFGKLEDVGKENTREGKSPRNKYKHLARLRKKEQEDNNLSSSTLLRNGSKPEVKKSEGNGEKLKEEAVIDKKLNKKPIQVSLGSTELEDPPKKRKKKEKQSDESQNNVKVKKNGVSEESQRKISKTEAIKIQTKDDDRVCGAPNKSLKKGKIQQSSTQTPISVKGKKRSAEVVTEAKVTEGGFSRDIQQPQATKIKKKGKRKSLDATTAANESEQPQDVPPIKRKNVDKQRNKEAIRKKVASSESDESTESPKKKRKLKHSSDKIKDSTPERNSNKISPSKSPFNINRLKNVLNRGADPSPDTETGVGQEGSPKAKAKGRGEQLTLRQRMEAQLSGARFRFINEQLYTCTGQEALGLMRQDPDAFKVYHEGFTSQVEKWPQNPVNHVIKFVKARQGTVVADLGCGDAKLSEAVPNTVHSFDLVAVNPRVTACDMAKVPLPDGSVDVAVFCLALMGTNLVDFVCEANRILKPSGTLVVAEVVSRFEKVGSFVRKMLKLGFELSKKDDSNKMFIWFEFTKTSEAPPVERRPALELMPCIYKKR